MRYLYVILACVVFGVGVYVGHRLVPGPGVRTVEVPVDRIRTQTVTREVIRDKAGTVTERTITKDEDASKAHPAPPAKQYRLGALLPLQTEFRAQNTTVTAGRRAFGGVWLDVQYDLKHQEIKAGVSYEF